MIKHFNIRVYALIINDSHEILLSDEYFRETYMTKFPGGGLTFGEGTHECLQREAVEEFGQAIEIIAHYYTTDYFQKALFFDDHQLISIYYLARFKESPAIRVSDKPFDFPDDETKQSFRWKSVRNLREEEFTFPIDKKVVGMLRDSVGQSL